MPARAKLQQFTFDRLVIDPELLGRRDIAAYPGGCRQATNMIGVIGGPVQVRGGLAFVDERPEASAGARLAAHEFKTEQNYLLLFTDREIRVYRDDVLQTATAIVSPFAAAQLMEMDYDQDLDTMILVHEDVAPRIFQRQGSHASWALSTVGFTNLPEHRFTGRTAGDATPSGTTGSITVISTASDFTDATTDDEISINGGTVVVTSIDSETQISGTVSSALSNTAVAIAGDWTIQGEVWSDSRGWPRSIRLDDNRSFWGGSKSLPQRVWGSASGGVDLFDFKETDEALDDEYVEDDLLGSGVNACSHILALGDQFFFSSGGVFVNALTDEKRVTPDTFHVRRQVTGAVARIKPVLNDDGAMCIMADGDGNAVYCAEILFDVDAGRYSADDLNLISATVLNRPVDMSARSSDGVRQANHRFVVNGDGSIAVHHALRRQQVNGWSKWVTPGNSGLDVALNTTVVGNAPYFLVRRRINGAWKYLIEKYDPDRVFDCSIKHDEPKPITGSTQADPVVISAISHGFSDGDVVRIDEIVGMAELNGRDFTIANTTENTFELSGEDGTGHETYVSGGVVRKLVTVIDGLDHLDGETVQVFADGAMRDPATVVNGSITVRDGGDTFPFAVGEAGLPFDWTLEPLPLEAQVAEGTLVGERHRVTKVTLEIRNAYPFKVEGRQLTFRHFGGFKMGQGAKTFSGRKTVRLMGWNRGQGATFTLTGRLPATILSAVAEVAQ